MTDAPDHAVLQHLVPQTLETSGKPPMPQDLLHCQAMFGLERGNQIQALVEDATGEDCPCIQGRTCPLAKPEPVPRMLAV